MFLSIFTDELDVDFAQALPLLRSWGFERCDLRSQILGKRLHELEAGELAEVRKLLAKHGMKAGALQSSLAKVHLPDSERQRAEAGKLEAIIRAADALDCWLVRAFNFWQPEEKVAGQLDPGRLEQAIEMFSPLARRAAQAGLVLAFENCGQSTEEALAVLDALDQPGWGLAWDACNYWDSHFRRENELLYIARNVRHSRMIHVKAESILPELKAETLPWDRILAAAQASGLEGPVSVETHNPSGSGMSHLEASRRTAELVRRAWPEKRARNVFAAAAPRPGVERSYAEQPVGFVIAGLGMGRVRALEIATTPGCELAGVCDRNEALAREVGEEFGVPHTAGLAQLLTDPRAEAVYVATPTGLHGALARQALEAGKHVLTTKPMEASVEACDAMIAAAESAGRLLAVDFEFRHRQHVLDLRSAAQGGVFGRLLGATAVLKVQRTDDYFRRKGGWRGTRKLDGGGVLSNQAIHHIDELIFILGLPAEVRGEIWTQNHAIEAEDLGCALWRYADGLVVSLFATTNFPDAAWYERLEVHGTKAACVSTRGGPAGEAVHWFVDGAWAEQPPRKAERPWLNSMDNLAAAIRTGAPLVCSGRDGRGSRLVLDAMYRSAENGGRWVSLAEKVYHVTPPTPPFQGGEIGPRCSPPLEKGG